MTAPTVTLVNGTGYQWGIASDELGINVRSFHAAIKPQFIESLGNKQNITVVDAYAPMELDLSIEGEINGTTGVNASVIGTAFVPVNSFAYNGAPTTGCYLQGADIKQGRNEWKNGTWTYRAKAGIP